MSNFLQLHFLTSYPPGNPNRDDTGRPKSAVFGGVPRMRISSQCLKRTWRTSSVFRNSLDGHLSQRTRRLGDKLCSYMQEKGVSPEQATEQAKEIAKVFGKPSTNEVESTRIQQLCFISPAENKLALELADRAIKGEEISVSPSDVLLQCDTAADIGMFGRMLADSPKFNREAAVQVSHALTTHRAIAEDDYYTALDDFVDEEDDTGAGFLGVQEFGSGVFYIYLCIDKDLLEENVDRHEGVRDASLSALIEAAATVSPGGKQASYGTRTLASYILAEKGTFQPRTLATAFLKPISGTNLLVDSISQMERFRTQLDEAYGPTSDDQIIMNVEQEHGTLADIIEFALT